MAWARTPPPRQQQGEQAWCVMRSLGVLNLRLRRARRSGRAPSGVLSRYGRLQPQFLRCCFAVWFRLAQTCAKSIRRFATLARLWLGLPSSCGIHTQPSEMAKIALRQQLPTCETRRPLRVDYTHRKEHTCVLANRIKTGFASHFGIFCVTRACVVVIYAVLGSVFKLPTA